MSEYIYGSSLRAAKSKANYLFDGDFRRRPNQNLSGASRSVARVELLQQAAQQRQSREDARRKENASLKIQSVYRGYRSRKTLAITLRDKFDTLASQVNTSGGSVFERQQFGLMSRALTIFYHSSHDEQRFLSMMNLMMSQPSAIEQSKHGEDKIWLHRMTRLLSINLDLIKSRIETSDRLLIPEHLRFFDMFTSPNTSLNSLEASRVWNALGARGFFSIMRDLVDSDECLEFVMKLIRRSLDADPSPCEVMPAYYFLIQFAHSPLTTAVHDCLKKDLLNIRPRHLEPRYLLEAIMKSSKHVASRLGSSLPYAPSRSAGPKDLSECKLSIWLCYLLLEMLHDQVDAFTEKEKVNYINIISVLLEPAEYLTTSLMTQASNSENDDRIDDIETDTTMDATVRLQQQLMSQDSEIYHVITMIVDLINQLPHINSLKPIIFSSHIQQQVQSAIVHICNLMLDHKYLAIFNCRLLHTVAFSKEFSRSLWRNIVTATSSSLYGTSVPIHVQISRGSQSISQESWRAVLPKLRLFCSLFSYLLPTLGDDEFYTSDEEQFFASNQSDQSGQTATTSMVGHGLLNGTTVSSSMNTYYVDKELVGISAILRDICVGMIEIIYQGNKQMMGHIQTSPIGVQGVSRLGSGGNFNLFDERAKSLSFEMRSCFQALVRLVSQLHARDSRKQFCPDGHWICPSIAIPANKAIDFQLVASQQGRLLNQMNLDDQSAERSAITPSEIKTVLILQEIPFVISFHDRVQIFHQLLRKERQIHQTEGYHFGLPGTAIKVQIRRNYIYEDAFEKLSFDKEPNMKLPLKVALINAVGADEAGIDGGGLSKEFLSELLKAGFDPMRGFFKYTNDHFLYPNPSANVLFANLGEGFEVHYEFLGRMLGKAIFEKTMVELPMASFFLAKLLAVKHSSDVDLHNLQSLDPVLYKNLVYLKNYKGDVADLNLDFTISNNDLDEHEIIELKPGGSKIPVTRENKIEYVHLVADYRLNRQIRSQCAAFKRGLAQLIDLDWLRMFDPRELQILISGAPTVIDVADWRNHTIYCNGYTDSSPAIQAFWAAVSQMDENAKRKLLKFATSCSLPPLLGFKDLVPQFAIAPSEEERLPTASTCMNLLKLPQIEEEETMRSKLLYAIESNSGFELS